MVRYAWQTLGLTAPANRTCASVGISDGDKMYPYRTQSQQLFLDFLGEPADSPRRTQDGVYTSHTIGSGQQTVKFILLDVRFVSFCQPCFAF
jgi:hypothetical protein